MNKSLITNLFCGAFILACGLISVSAQTQPNNSALPPDAKSEAQNITVSQEKRRKAEQVVIRAMRRFGQTLDFNDVYREMYVRDKTVRQGEIDSMKRDIEKGRYIKFNRNISEKLYMKGKNTLLLVVLCVLEKKCSDISEKEIFSNFNKRQRILYLRLWAAEESEPFFESRAEVIDALSAADIAANILRKRLSQKLRQDMQYKVTIDTFKLSKMPDDKPYLSKYKNFYKITPKINKKLVGLSFTVVEESGVMRILSMTIVDD
ncbi:MAG: hypothetical protein ACR2LT_01920 [Pyrinomonadaceae bacterium]